MGGGAQELKGPDLTQGVPERELREGASLLGHAHGEAVLLTKSNGQLFATGATCTHYGGPLAEGLVADGTVRCPWHHACFDLRTGAPKAPALGMLPCYDVRSEGGLVRVGGKREPTGAPPPANAPESVVIVGGGAAGHACALELRRQGYTGPVTVLSAEETGPVDRPNLSKDYLAGTAPEEWIPLADLPDVTLRTGDAVEAVDLATRTVRTRGGRTETYGALLLATGAEPIVLPIPGAEHAHVLRTLADSRAIASKAKGSAVVIGASFIALEAAAALRTRGVDVAVVAPEAIPLSRVLGDEVGRFVQSLHEEKGVRFHLGRRPARIDADAVHLDDGTRLEANAVVLGVGVRPRLGLAQAAGLRVDNGVIVDGELRTSAPGVWAAGDIARTAQGRIEHWVVAQRQGQAAARSMLGRGAGAGTPPFFWSQHYDLPIAYVGHSERPDSIEVRGTLQGRDACVIYREGGHVAALATVYRDQVSLQAERLWEVGDQAGVDALAAAQ